MIICTNCGNHNEDGDEFCGSCGKFLEWVGQRVEQAAPVAAPEPEPEPEPAKVGIVDRVKAAVGIDDHGAPPDPAANGAAEAEAEAAANAAREAELAANAAAAAEQQRLEAEAAEATRRATLAEEESRRRAEEQAKADAEAEAARLAKDEATAKAAAEAEAARFAEQEARRRAEDEARAVADAERRRAAEAEAARQAEEEAVAVAAAEAAAAAAAEAARLAQAEAEREAIDAAARAAAEAEAARQAEEARLAAAAAEAARHAQVEAQAKAEAEAVARAAAEAREQAETEARRRAEDEARRRAEEEAKARAVAEARAREQEEARLRAEEETRARLAAEARAKQEEEARKRAAALLSRPKAAPAAPAVDGPDPAVAPPPVAAAASTPPPAPAAVKPVAQQPVAQQPSSMKAPPRPDPKTKPEERVIKAGDLVCDQCGEGNDPARKFCRKCGNSLAKAVPAKKIPWWKKLFSGGKGRTSKEKGGAKAKLAKANEARFKSRLWLARIRYVLGFLAIFGIAGVGFARPNLRAQAFDWVRNAGSSAKDLFNPQFEPVNAIEVTASSEAPNHPAGLANDLGSNTYWAEGAEGEGIGQSISFRFEAKVDLTKVIISSGAAESPDVFLNQPRPKQLHLVFDNGGSADITLKDEIKDQGFTLKGAKGVSKVDVVISAVYKAKAGGGADTAIAEVEFKKKG